MPGASLSVMAQELTGLLRLQLMVRGGGKSYELVSCHLRDLSDITAVLGAALQAFNPGSVASAA
jgi:hypothetical protein